MIRPRKAVVIVSLGKQAPNYLAVFHCKVDKPGPALHSWIVTDFRHVRTFVHSNNERLTIFKYFTPISMVTRNIIIFGDPLIDRRFLLKLLGISVTRNPNVLPLLTVFETQTHLINTRLYQYVLYNTAGLYSDSSNLEPRQLLSNLYRFTRAIDSGINLLIYVVDNKHSIDNIRLFHDFFCRRDAPIILVTSNSCPPSLSESDKYLPRFGAVLTLTGANPERDKYIIGEAISANIKRDPKDIHPMDRFEITAIQSWKLLERTAGLSIPKWRDALKATLMDQAFFSEQDASAKCQDIVDFIKK